MTEAGGFIVTGAAGFIGCNIVAALNERGHDNILLVDTATSPEKQANLDSLRYREIIDKHAFRNACLADQIPAAKTVFHMGACSSTTERDTEFLEDNNTRYTRQLCEWSLEHGARFIYASSAATYGDGREGYADDDRLMHHLKPLNPYGQSKHAFDQWALEAGLLDRIVGLKYFNVYGPHEDHKGEMRSMVNKAFAQIRQNGHLELFKSYKPEYADGEQDRDFVYVADAVDVTMFFHEEPNVSGLYNCGTGEARTWTDLATAVFAALSREPNIRMIEMPEAIRDQYQYHTQADITKLRGAGYTKAFTSLEKGVSRYVQGYLVNEQK